MCVCACGFLYYTLYFYTFLKYFFDATEIVWNIIIDS